MTLNKGDALLLREHESHIRKSEQAYFLKETFRVTFVDENVDILPSIIDQNGNINELKQAQLIGLNDLILSNESRIEIRDNTGLVFRIGPHSEFSLEQTVIGISPVYYGSIYKTRFSGIPSVMCGGKYRTSCYTQCMNTLFTENESSNTDVFYGLSDDIHIWEYDEWGRRFPIVSITEGQKVILKFDDSKQMRERYTVVNVDEITDADYDRITNNFMNNKNWR